MTPPSQNLNRHSLTLILLAGIIYGFYKDCRVCLAIMVFVVYPRGVIIGGFSRGPKWLADSQEILSGIRTVMSLNAEVNFFAEMPGQIR